MLPSTSVSAQIPKSGKTANKTGANRDIFVFLLLTSALVSPQRVMAYYAPRVSKHEIVPFVVAFIMKPP